ncbi:MAG: oligosaccharide flippase family protein [Dysgonomonas sp.]|nr:oligosaccharide flippase family protein [Dysgonomonas sp.]
MKISTHIINPKNIFFKIKNNHNFKNGILFTLFSFLNNGINFLLLIILASYLAPEGYGKLNLFTTSITIFTVLIPLGTSGFVSICFFNKTIDELKSVINIISTISFLILILLSLILFLGRDFFFEIFSFSFDYQFLALLICFFQVFNLLNLELWRLEEKPVKYGFYSLGIAVANLLLSILFVISFKMEWNGRVYAQLIITFLFFILSLIFLIRKKYFLIKKINIPLLKETLYFGIPLIPHQISGWLRQGIDRYIINFYISTATVGLFSFAFNFANIIHMVGAAFNASNSVFIYKNLGKKDDKIRIKLLKQTQFMCLLFAIITIFIIIGAYILIPYIFPKYTSSRSFLVPLCSGAFFQCVYYLFVNYLFYFKRTKILMYITITGSIMHLILSFLFTRYSIMYTAYITLFSNFVICILVILYSQKIYPLFEKKNSK